MKKNEKVLYDITLFHFFLSLYIVSSYNSNRRTSTLKTIEINFINRHKTDHITVYLCILLRKPTLIYTIGHLHACMHYPSFKARQQHYFSVVCAHAIASFKKQPSIRIQCISNLSAQI